MTTTEFDKNKKFIIDIMNQLKNTSFKVSALFQHLVKVLVSQGIIWYNLNVKSNQCCIFFFSLQQFSSQHCAGQCSTLRITLMVLLKTNLTKKSI